MAAIINRIHPGTIIGDKSVVGYWSIIGYPEDKLKPVKIGNNSKIGNHVRIDTGTTIKNNVLIDDFTIIEKDTKIDNGVSIESHSFIGSQIMINEGTIILYGSRIYEKSIIGKKSRIGGFVAENVVIGNNTSIFGKIIHSFRNPTNWDGGEESPIIDDYVVVGFNASVIGDVQIGHHVYIAAGAVISKDVPPHSIVTGVNKITPLKDWKGRLRNSEFWEWGN